MNEKGNWHLHDDWMFKQREEETATMMQAYLRVKDRFQFTTSSEHLHNTPKKLARRSQPKPKSEFLEE